AEAGIVALDSRGQVISYIGESYDQNAPPKPGQLGKPVALALAQDDRLLYVADAGKYPQIAAFGLNGSHAVNAAAGTVDGGKMVYGQTVSGVISTQTFIYLYTFDAKGGDSATITMRAAPESGLDPFLELYYQNANGGLARLAWSDDEQIDGLAPTDA